MFKPFDFQPGWATPMVVRHEPSFFATFFRLAGERNASASRFFLAPPGSALPNGRKRAPPFDVDQTRPHPR
jgi:hypothetical protein